MWYAYEGENDMYAIPVEAVKEIIEMNKNQQYPEKLEDYQTEFMSNSVLMEENSNEFEMELLKMEDSLESIEITNNTNKKSNNNHQRNGKTDNNDKNNARNKNNEHRHNNKNIKRSNKQKHHNGNETKQ